MSQSHQELLKQAAAKHLDNLRENLQRRIKTARNSGNGQLLKILEAEATYLGMN